MCRDRNVELGIDAVAFEPDGTLLTGSTDGTVPGLGVGAGEPEADEPRIRTGARVVGLSTGGRRFLVRLPGSLRVYTDSGELVSTIHTTTQHAVLSPGGRGVATTQGEGRPALGRVDRRASPHARRATAPLVNDAEFSPNGLELVTVS